MPKKGPLFGTLQWMFIILVAVCVMVSVATVGVMRDDGLIIILSVVAGFLAGFVAAGLVLFGMMALESWGLWLKERKSEKDRRK